MVFFLLALVVSVIGIAPFFIPGNLPRPRSRAAVISMFVAYLLFSWMLMWLTLPSLAYPLLGKTVVTAIVLSLISIGLNKTVRGIIVPLLIVLVVAVYAFFSTSAIFHARAYAAMIGRMTDDQNIKHWSKDIAPIDPKHIRLVPEETAIALAKTALNQNATSGSQAIVGSQFDVDAEHITLQKVKDRLLYVIPLDYRSLGSYYNTAGIPGYVIVDAEDPQAKPQFIEKQLMKYSPESFFEHNLERHLYTNGYYNKVLTDYSFELDDNMKPYWVITVCEPTIGYAGEKVNGVAIVEPLTGEITFKKVSEVPDWVDRVYPAEIIKTYLADWGDYALGWWNSVWANLNQKSTEDITLNYGADGRCYYVTPMTSANAKDASMTDLIYTDTKTGVSKRYIVAGTTEEHLLAAVSAKLAYQHLQGVKVIYENVYGRMTAIISVLGEDGSYRGVAFVDVTNKSILAYDPAPLNALRAYQSLLSQSGGQIATDDAADRRTITAIISRLNYEQTQSGLQLDIYIDTIPHAFYVNCSQFVTAPFAKVGDTVVLSYFNTPSAGISVNDFTDKQVKINLSENQQAVEVQNKGGK
jgi:hypothetical protein